MKPIRLYGYRVGEGSFVQVTRGLERALRYWEALEDVVYLDDEEYRESAAEAGAACPVSINVGPPEGLVAAHRFGQHKEHWLLVAPNAETLPESFARSLIHATDVLPRGLLDGGLLAPSRWAVKVLKQALPERPVIHCPHGVDGGIYSEAGNTSLASFERGEFRVLHLSSTDAERKSTRALIDAWALLVEQEALPSRATLYIVMNPLDVSRIEWWARAKGPAGERIRVTPGLTRAPDELAEIYRQAHIVCQPSRAEGFGLVPLEARCCGTPVVATRVTGHTEGHVEGAGTVEVVVGRSAPLDDYPGATAPSVSVTDIADAIRWAAQQWTVLHAEAMEHAAFLRSRWSWENQSASAIAQILERHKAAQGEITWRQ